MKSKSILIITPIFPPQAEVGGLRPAMFAKYLKEFGWNVFVITRDFTKQDSRYNKKMNLKTTLNEGVEIIRVPYSSVDEFNYIKRRSIIQKARDFFYPEFSSPPGLYFKVKEEAELFLKNNKIDLILSTIPDQWVLSLGAFLSKKNKCKFVVDFRDIVEQEAGLKRNYREYIQTKRFLLRRYLTTRNASLLTTVSSTHKKIIQNKLKKHTFTIYNGYDKDCLKKKLKNEETILPFKITYVGRILNLWYRDPSLLFRSIDELITENKISNKDISIEFYGSEKSLLKPLISDLKNNFIVFHSRVNFSSIPKVLNNSQLLLVLTNKGRKGILTTKFFEYIGSQKPILCIPGDQGELDELILKYELGYTFSDSRLLKIKLLELISNYKNGKFNEFILDTTEGVFTRKKQSEYLDNLLNSLFKQ